MLASAASPRTMGFRPKWKSSSASPFATNDKIRPQHFAPSRRRRAHRRSLREATDVRPWFSLTSRGLTPCPNQTTTFPLLEPLPVRLPKLRSYFPDVPENPSSELQPPPSPAAAPESFAGTAPAPAEPETLRRENGRLRDKINEVLEKHPELRDATDEIALT